MTQYSDIMICMHTAEKTSVISSCKDSRVDIFALLEFCRLCGHAHVCVKAPFAIWKLEFIALLVSQEKGSVQMCMDIEKQLQTMLSVLPSQLEKVFLQGLCHIKGGIIC